MLQSVSLPSKHVVAVLSIAGVITVAENKRLAAISRPVSLVVELASVPDYFVVHLRDLDWVGGRALGVYDGEGSRAGRGMGDVFRVGR